jgi:two-component system alkaline phosphatase synthesis response regulator PhoP
METATILIVDDEQPIVDLVASYLAVEGYDVHHAYDGMRALEVARAVQPDLIVLDLMLPGLDGVEVCRRLQAESAPYIVMLSARSEEVDKLIGLSVGADDYVTKPFSPRELVARVKAILRRSRPIQWQPATQPPIQLDTLLIDPSKREVWKESTSIDLTPREFDLLYTLAQHPGHVFTREELLRRVWGDDFDGIDRVVDVHVGTLRRKLDDEALLIQTVRGVGYKLVGKAAPAQALA